MLNRRLQDPFQISPRRAWLFLNWSKTVTNRIFVNNTLDVSIQNSCFDMNLSEKIRLLTILATRIALSRKAYPNLASTSRPKSVISTA